MTLFFPVFHDATLSTASRGPWVPGVSGVFIGPEPGETEWAWIQEHQAPIGSTRQSIVGL